MQISYVGHDAERFLDSRWAAIATILYVGISCERSTVKSFNLIFSASVRGEAPPQGMGLMIC